MVRFRVTLLFTLLYTTYRVTFATLFDFTLPVTRLQLFVVDYVVALRCSCCVLLPLHGCCHVCVVTLRAHRLRCCVVPLRYGCSTRLRLVTLLLRLLIDSVDCYRVDLPWLVTVRAPLHIRSHTYVLRFTLRLRWLVTLRLFTVAFVYVTVARLVALRYVTFTRTFTVGYVYVVIYTRLRLRLHVHPGYLVVCCCVAHGYRLHVTFTFTRSPRLRLVTLRLLVTFALILPVTFGLHTVVLTDLRLRLITPFTVGCVSLRTFTFAFCLRYTLRFTLFGWLHVVTLRCVTLRCRVYVVTHVTLILPHFCVAFTRGYRYARLLWFCVQFPDCVAFG